MKSMFLPDILTRLIFSVLLFLGAQFSFAQSTLCEQNNQFTPEITIGFDQTSVTSTSSLGAGWTNKNVLIRGTLEVNSDFQISNCVLKMDDLAKIDILAGSTLVSTFSKYFHCPLSGGTNLWTGIKATGNLTFFFNQVEDADKALEIKSATAAVLFVGNTINRNNYGIFVENTAINAVVAANTFDCNTPINGSTTAIGIAGVSLIRVHSKLSHNRII